MAQGYFPTFTPKVMDLTDIYKNFNPAASFLGGMKAVRDMELDQAVEERLRESADMDRMVKSTMLPYEVELAKAKIQGVNADTQRSLAYAKYLGTNKEIGTENLSRAERRALLDSQYGGKTLLGGFDNALGRTESPFSTDPGYDTSSSDPALGEQPSQFFDDLGGESGENPIFDNLPPSASASPDETPVRFANVNLPVGTTQSDVPTLAGQMVNNALDSQKGNRATMTLRGMKMNPEEPDLDPEAPEDRASRVWSDLGRPDPAPPAPSKIWTALQGRRRIYNATMDAARSNPNDDGLYVEAGAAARGAMNDMIAAQDRLLTDYGMPVETAEFLVNKFGNDPAVLDEALFIKRRTGQDWGVIGDVIAKQRETIGAPDRSLTEHAENAVRFATVAQQTEGAEREAALQNVAMYTALSIPEEERPRVLQERQARYTSTFQNFTNGKVNFEGVEITKDMPPEKKVTAAEHFRKNAGIDYPVIRGTILPDGNLDTDDDAIARISQFYSDRRTGILDNSLVGVLVKTEAGEEVVPYSFRLNRQKPEESELTSFIDLNIGSAGTGGDRKKDANPDAVDSSSLYSDLGLKAREPLAKSVIATGLTAANVGPAMTNFASGLYETGESFITGRNATPIARYRLYDGSDVDRIYSKFNPLDDLPDESAKKPKNAPEKPPVEKPKNAPNNTPLIRIVPPEERRPASETLKMFFGIDK